MRYLALILTLYLSVITVTPALCSTYSVIKKVTLCCSEQKCSNKTGDCKRGNDTCTPCCLMQNCCCNIVALPEFNFMLEGISTEKKILTISDNALSDYLSDCWNPPKLI